MQLKALRVIHLAKKTGAGICPAGRVPLAAFFLETCQRWIWVTFGSQSVAHFERLIPGAEVLEGKSAYCFLLKFATGLESEVLGETDVFGQLKTSWRQFSFSLDSTHQDLVVGLGPWMQRVFEDTKEIRSSYLQNLGGSSYGTLVRKLLSKQGPVLLVGAGQIAQSVAPFLSDFEVWLSNRNPNRLQAFYESLTRQSPSQFKRQMRRVDCDQEEEAWKWAQQVVICIPFDPEKDPQRVTWFQQGLDRNRTVIHLGGIRAHAGVWSELPNFYCLSELFSLQNSILNLRSTQISRALRACQERAQVRALGASLSIPHGWEDLACFV